MKHIHHLFPIIIAALLISACGSALVTATVSGGDVQSTAIAAAFTVVAKTHEARPTNTIAVPTETPTLVPLPTETATLSVTETPPILSSLEPASTAAATTAAGGNSDSCNAPLQSLSGGKSTIIKLENDTGAPITLSIYLNQTPFGDCGYRGYAIAKGSSILITDLIQACYNVSVLVNDPKKPTKSFGYGCINNDDKWTFIISRDSVILKGR